MAAKRRRHAESSAALAHNLPLSHTHLLSAACPLAVLPMSHTRGGRTARTSVQAWRVRHFSGGRWVLLSTSRKQTWRSRVLIRDCLTPCATSSMHPVTHGDSRDALVQSNDTSLVLWAAALQLPKHWHKAPHAANVDKLPVGRSATRRKPALRCLPQNRVSDSEG